MCIDQSGDNPVSADVNNLRIIGQADLFVRANRRNPLATYQNDSLRKRLTSTVENSGARQGPGVLRFPPRQSFEKRLGSMRRESMKTSK